MTQGRQSRPLFRQQKGFRMIRPMKVGVVTLVTGALVIVPAAEAKTTLVNELGQPSSLNHTILARSQMPSPTVTLIVHRSVPCFDGEPRSCTTSDRPEIWLSARADLLHELGHRFDYLMSNTMRLRFLSLTRDNRPWRSPPNSPHERFAEAYRLCAQNPRTPDLSDVGYNYAPSKRTHRKVCRSIRREAARQGWTR